ncbi:MAG: diacylglycerol kinase family protein [Oscillospiraceae bacterium]
MKNKPIRSLGRSFCWAARGIWTCILNERNMRIHLTVALYLAFLGPLFHLTLTQQCIILLCVALVIALEMVNTALETVINLCSPQYHVLAGLGKDIAAGAVLVAAFFSAVVGVRLFWKPHMFLQLGQALIHSLLQWQRCWRRWCSGVFILPAEAISGWFRRARSCSCALE